MTDDELQWMHLKDQYAELARAAGSPTDAWFGDPLEHHEQVLKRVKVLAEGCRLSTVRLQANAQIVDAHRIEKEN